MSQEANIGILIRSLLKKHSLSMRQLSARTGIDTATISRIVNGKQQAKLSHLQQFASYLDIPVKKLVDATIFNDTQPVGDVPADIHHSVDSIQKALGASSFFDQEFTAEQVSQELVKYEQYAKTAEGNQIIHAEFDSKVNQVNGTGPFIEQLQQMFDQYCQEKTSVAVRAILGSALLYFILSTDVIPDYVFPIGYLDDAIAVQLVQQRLSQMDHPV